MPQNNPVIQIMDIGEWLEMINNPAMFTPSRIHCNIKEADVEASYCYTCPYAVAEFGDGEYAVFACQQKNAKEAAFPALKVGEETIRQVDNRVLRQMDVSELPMEAQDPTAQFVENWGGQVMGIANGEFAWFPEGVDFGFTYGHKNKPGFDGAIEDLEFEGYVFDKERKLWTPKSAVKPERQPMEGVDEEMRHLDRDDMDVEAAKISNRGVLYSEFYLGEDGHEYELVVGFDGEARISDREGFEIDPDAVPQDVALWAQQVLDKRFPRAGQVQ